MRDLPAVIRNRHYWRVVLRPVSFRMRIRNVTECKNMIEEASVRYRGVPFPHISNRVDENQLGQDWAAGTYERDDYKEYWRCFQSGQFVHLSNPKEAFDGDYVRRVMERLRRRFGHRNDIIWQDITGFLGIKSIVYRLTEIMELAARLAERGLYTEPLSVRVGLHIVCGRVLSWGLEGDWSNFLQATTDRIDYERTFATDELVASRGAIAIAAATALLERFGWSPETDSILRDTQEELLGR